MKKRIITAAIALPLLFLLLLVAPKIVTTLVWGGLMAIGTYELLFRTGLVTEIRLLAYSMGMSVIVTLWSHFGAVEAYGLLILIAFMMILFAEMMFSHVNVSFEKICMCMVAGFLVPMLLGSMIRILVTKIGRYVILIPFIVAFLADGGAYFVGRFFGRHKLAPVVSCHKTVEGALGGVACAVVGMVVYAMVLQFAFRFRVNYLYAIIYGLLGSVIGVFGDLCFSVIKRQTGIKDYGNLIPGHGGVLDRFESRMLVGPLMEALLAIMPMAV